MRGGLDTSAFVWPVRPALSCGHVLGALDAFDAFSVLNVLGVLGVLVVLVVLGMLRAAELLGKQKNLEFYFSLNFYPLAKRGKITTFLKIKRLIIIFIKSIP